MLIEYETQKITGNHADYHHGPPASRQPAPLLLAASTAPFQACEAPCASCAFHPVLEHIGRERFSATVCQSPCGDDPPPTPSSPSGRATTGRHLPLCSRSPWVRCASAVHKQADARNHFLRRRSRASTRLPKVSPASRACCHPCCPLLFLPHLGPPADRRCRGESLRRMPKMVIPV